MSCRDRLVSVGALWMLVASVGTLPLWGQDGAAVFKTYCALCHESGDGERAPSRDVLGRMSPEQILSALEKGSMQAQAAERSRAQRRALAEYLSGKAFGADPFAPLPASAYCAADVTTDVKAADAKTIDTKRIDVRTGDARILDRSLGGPGNGPTNGLGWNGWGGGITNTRLQSQAAGGLSAADLPRLKLKWAFGLPGASSGGTQPVVMNGRLYFGDAEGDLFALDARTGCIHWRTEMEASIRTAPVLGSALGARGGDGLMLYLGDQAANVYAVNAATGKVLWKRKVDDYTQAAITASPQLYEGRLYVPVSSREESKVGDPHYPCCAFRGSVVALDAATGRQIWKTYTIEREAAPSGKNSVGTVIVGPSGVPVWNTPTIDAKRKVLYVGTGNNYSPPATAVSDSIVSFNLKSGSMTRLRQHTEDDIWNAACRGAAREPAVCPDGDAPDVDFGSSPVLVEAKGRRLLIAGNKSGSVWALDPDNGGKLIWEQHVGSGSGGGVLWGIAVDTGAGKVYVPNSFFNARAPDDSGGVAAFDLSTGKSLWSTPNPPCGSRSPCKSSHAAAVMAIPGAVLSGTMDGQLFAYASDTGAVLWHTETAQSYTTVNGVSAKGGSMSNSGPTVAGGMVYVQSGYSHHGAILPGNVLLAFAAE